MKRARMKSPKKLIKTTGMMRPAKIKRKLTRMKKKKLRQRAQRILAKKPKISPTKSAMAKSPVMLCLPGSRTIKS